MHAFGILISLAGDAESIDKAVFKTLSWAETDGTPPLSDVEMVLLPCRLAGHQFPSMDASIMEQHCRQSPCGQMLSISGACQ